MLHFLNAFFHVNPMKLDQVYHNSRQKLLMIIKVFNLKLNLKMNLEEAKGLELKIRLVQIF